MSQAPLPPERYAAFLWVRRGVPLAGLALALALSYADARHAGWWLLAAAAAFFIALPTFATGASYLAQRRSILWWDGVWVKAFRPLARQLDLEEAWILSFCGWNNRRVRQAFEGRKARRSLVLLPHCIQMSRCKAEIFEDLQHCYECGLCPVEDVLHGVLQRQWDARITNRSHKAYRAAREFQPDLIVAVSCTDRLLKGLLKVADVPAYAIPLTLPHGMCVDTSFAVPHLVAAMDTLAEPRKEPRIQPLDTAGAVS